MFFGLAGLAATSQPTSNLNPATFRFCGLLAAAAALSLSVGIVGIMLLRWTSQHLELALVASALLFAGLFAASAGRPILVAFAVFAFCASNTLGATDASYGIYAVGEHCKDRAGAFRALIDSNRFLTRFTSNSRDMFVWWNKDEVLHDQQGCTMRISDFAVSMVSFGFQYLAPPWSGMPDVDALPADSISAIGGPRKIAVVTSEDSNVKRLMAHYAQSGVKLELNGETIIRTSRFSFSYMFLELARGNNFPER